MAQLKIQGKIHTRATNNEYHMEFILRDNEEITTKKEQILLNYLPIKLKKNDSEYSTKLQNTVSNLNIGDEVEVTIEPKGNLGKNDYLGKCFVDLTLISVKIITKAQVVKKQEEQNTEDDTIPF